VTEFLEECKQGTPNWKERPYRMLRHKAFMQCARLAFGITGVMDREEVEEATSAKQVRLTPIKQGAAGLGDALSAAREASAGTGV
jgi:hypothetical protein